MQAKQTAVVNNCLGGVRRERRLFFGADPGCIDDATITSPCQASWARVESIGNEVHWRTETVGRNWREMARLLTSMHEMIEMKKLPFDMK